MLTRIAWGAIAPRQVPRDVMRVSMACALVRVLRGTKAPVWVPRAKPWRCRRGRASVMGPGSSKAPWSGSQGHEGPRTVPASARVWRDAMGRAKRLPCQAKQPVRDASDVVHVHGLHMLCSRRFSRFLMIAWMATARVNSGNYKRLPGTSCAHRIYADCSFQSAPIRL